MGQRIIELKWTCGSCGTSDILGRHKACPQCGNPREQGEMQMDGLGSSSYEGGYNKAASVSDARLLEAASAGADKFCAFCASGNAAAATACARCGASDFVPHRPERSPGVRSKPEGASLGRKVRSSRTAGRRWNPTRITALVMILGACSSGCLGCFFFFFWGMSTHAIHGSVTSMSWVHKTHRERFKPVTRSGWRSDIRERPARMPVKGKGEDPGADIISCTDKHHHYEKYACGTSRECSPNYRSESYACGETCRDNGNGFATCTTKYCTRSIRDGETCRDVTKYCDRSIKKPHCSYRTHAWTHVATKKASGTSKKRKERKTRWRKFKKLGDRDRTRREGQWKVVITWVDDDEKGDREEKPSSERSYLSWKMGEEVVLDRNNLGSITQVYRGAAADARLREE